jgi:hypothetical protein
MSAYSSFLAGSQHGPLHSKPTPRNHTPTKQLTSALSSPDLFNSAHQPRPTTHLYPPHPKQQLVNPRPPIE